MWIPSPDSSLVDSEGAYQVGQIEFNIPEQYRGYWYVVVSVGESKAVVNNANNIDNLLVSSSDATQAMFKVQKPFKKYSTFKNVVEPRRFWGETVILERVVRWKSMENQSKCR